MNPAWPHFITDTGSAQELVSDSGEKMALPRYGVWMYSRSRGKYIVTEASNDLDALQKKYGPGLDVHAVIDTITGGKTHV